MFHVQTEDSGRKNPHIISHLYFGGTILASQKRDYDEHLESENLDDQVRSLMEAQHKAMLKRLKGGDFDAVISERLGGETGEGSTTSPSINDEPAPGGAASVAARASDDNPDRAFGDTVVSQKPLDEVILEYLVQKARNRKGPMSQPEKRRSRESRPKG